MAEAQVTTNFNPAELLKRVEDTEKRLQTKDAEIQVYKMLMAQMEEELAQAKKFKAIHEKQSQDIDSIKTESEKTLTKAKSLIFERTKIIKNQELQIEAFVQQIESLKEVVRITKDLLEIRTLEIKQLETKMSAIEGKMKAEHERYELMHKKLEQMIRHNGELKREYETQLCLFSALRERYSERELAKNVVDELQQDIEADKVEKANDDNKSTTKESEVISENKPIQSDQETAPTLPTIENSGKETTTENIDGLQNTNAVADAKNRLDSILTVLENTFGIDSTDSKDKSDNPTTGSKDICELDTVKDNNENKTRCPESVRVEDDVKPKNNPSTDSAGTNSEDKLNDTTLTEDVKLDAVKDNVNNVISPEKIEVEQSKPVETKKHSESVEVVEEKSNDPSTTLTEDFKLDAVKDNVNIAICPEKIEVEHSKPVEPKNVSESVEVVNNINKNDVKVENNPPTGETSSTIDNIISVIKNTIGLGGESVTEKEVTKENIEQHNN